jgi:hypothetical protein
MTAAASTDKRVAFPLAFATVALLGAIGMTVFGITGDQVASGWSFAVAMVAGALSVAAYHAYN